MPIVWNNPELPVQLQVQRLGVRDMAQQAATSSDMLEKVRDMMLDPTKAKEPPVLKSEALADLCGIKRESVAWKVTKGELPPGTVPGKGKGREFTLAEARAWIRAHRPSPPRPPGAKALAIAVANTKGGVMKTTLATTLAQGLSLRGYSCLLVDCDPQGSATTLMGAVPEKDVRREDTVIPFLEETQPDLRYAVSETYWDGVDLIPANTYSYEAEMFLPAKANRNPLYKLWDQINLGLEPLRDQYDVIVIDTSPALSYMTINAMFAADGLLVPTPPNALDYAAGAQFWALFGDLVSQLAELRPEIMKKQWEFTHVVPTNVDQTTASTMMVREWMSATYGTKLFPAEIPSSKVAAALSAEFKTVYDVAKYEGNMRSYARLRDAYDRFCEVIDLELGAIWEARAKQGVTA